MMFMKVWLNQYNVHLSIFHITETDNSKRNVSVNLSQRLQQFNIGKVSVETMELDQNFSTSINEVNLKQTKVTKCLCLSCLKCLKAPTYWLR